jgi:hypothetical protein
MGKRQAYHVCVCVCARARAQVSTFQILNQLTDFHKIRYKHYATEANPSSYFINSHNK